MNAIPLEQALDGVLGVELETLTPEAVHARIPVTPRICQRFGLVHGGAYCAIAEFLASEGTIAGVHARGSAALGQQNATHFLRPVGEGTLHAQARPLSRGRTAWVWDVDFRDDGGRLCATSRVTIAVRPAPGEV